MSRNFLTHLHPPQVNCRTLRPLTTLGLGTACLGCLAILIATGVTLFLSYQPDQDIAYERILHISTTLRFGGLIRDLHYLAANALVIFAVLHLTRVVLTGSYRRRWRNWCYGLILFGLLLAANFTGYLLPWDQISYWAVKVGAGLADYFPILGSGLKIFLLGGRQIGSETLLRCFALHAGIIPVLFLLITGLHLWRIRKDGGLVSPPQTTSEKLPANPWLFRAEASAFLLLWTLLLILTQWLHAPIFERADPAHPPNPAKAPWYFVGFQEMVSHSATWGGVVIPTVLALFLVFLPKMDHGSGIGGVWLARERRSWNFCFLLLLGSQLILILIGQFCRGSNWQWVWPH